jgi:hypothetical protein
VNSTQAFELTHPKYKSLRRTASFMDASSINIRICAAAFHQLAQNSHHQTINPAPKPQYVVPTCLKHRLFRHQPLYVVVSLQKTFKRERGNIPGLVPPPRPTSASARPLAAKKGIPYPRGGCFALQSMPCALFRMFGSRPLRTLHNVYYAPWQCTKRA